MCKPLVVAVLMLTLAGCVSTLEVQFRIAEEEPRDDLAEMTLAGWGNRERFFVHREVPLTEADIVSASYVMWRGKPAIMIDFSEEGRAQLASITAENINKRLGMIVDGKLVCAPVIRAQLPGGTAVIEGDFTRDEARKIADRLGR